MQKQPTQKLPSGTLTFLFTDIEGSTKLWQSHPDQMRPALARHDLLAADTISSHDGVLVKGRGEGDSLFAVFPRATDAVAAALALQRSYVAEAWPFPSPMRVRMASHTGEADLRDGDYYGSAVNRCARLLAVAHGGQVLVSRTTFDLVRDALPDEASVRDLGEFRLSDLVRPEQVFQIVHPDLPAEFPPLRSLDALPNNLSEQLTSFIGREHEMAEVKRLLHTTRLLTLTGAGGVGKSRLSIQVAADLLDHYPDGVWLVELAALSDPAFVPQSVAAVLGVREEAGRTIPQRLADYLKPKTLLLILDNCEHLLGACAVMADHLLRACPRLRILTTSREGIGLAGEQRYRVPPLSLPDPKNLPPFEAMSQYEAVSLFIERARLVKPSFSVTSANAPALSQVCHWLDGMPLAIELAAARVRTLSVEQIMSRLHDCFHLLVGGSRTGLPRQQTLRALIDWSYNLLDEREKVLLDRLSIFPGGCRLEAAEAVCSGEGFEAWDVLDLLSSLEDKSLLVVDESNGAALYHLLETIRLYAQERLLSDGDEATVRGRYQSYYLHLLRDAPPDRGGAGLADTLKQLEAEHTNIRVALQWYLQHEQELAAEMALALSEFWYAKGLWTEGRYTLASILEERTNISDSSLSSVLHEAAWLASLQGDFIQAKVLSEEYLAVVTRSGDRKRYAAALRLSSHIALNAGNLLEARERLQECLSILEEVGDGVELAETSKWMAWVAERSNDLDQARLLLEESIERFHEAGCHLQVASARTSLGRVLLAQGDCPQARSQIELSRDALRKLGDVVGFADALQTLARVAKREGDLPEARTLLEQSLSLFQQFDHKSGIASRLRDLGFLATDQKDFLRARAAFEQSLTLFEEMGYKQEIVEVLSGLSEAARRDGDIASADAYSERVLALYEQRLSIHQERGERSSIALTLEQMGHFASEQGNYRAVRLYYGQCLAVRREMGNRELVASTLLSLGRAAERLGFGTDAGPFLEESLEIRRGIGGQSQTSFALACLGNAAMARGDLEAAHTYFDESLAMRRPLSDQEDVAYSLTDMGNLTLKEGQLEAAKNLYRQSLAIWKASGDNPGAAFTLAGLVQAASEEGQAERAAHLLGAVNSLAEDVPARWPWYMRADYERDLTDTRAALGDEAFAAAWAEGRAMTLDQAVDYALDEDPPKLPSAIPNLDS